MASNLSYDVIIVGGGLAGSALGGVLARAGLGVLIVEREARFCDRIRGELTWPWGVAEIERLGLTGAVERAGGVRLAAIHSIEQREVVGTQAWAAVPMRAFPHPALQDELFGWAGSLGASTLRPAKAIAFARDGKPTLTVSQDGHEVDYAARLVVGADGKLSGARRWIGAETVADPPRHRFGGVLVTGVAGDRDVFYDASVPGISLFWFAQSAEATRLYLGLSQPRAEASGTDPSIETFLAYTGTLAPKGAFADAHQVGPAGFFADTNIWASRVAGDDLVLIGDAAGAADPTLGHGTSLLFRDVRELSDLLIGERDWRAAIAEFARRRQRYYEVIRANDRWCCLWTLAEGPEADRRRERRQRAKELDPTLGGFALIEERGPDGLVPDEASRRHYFGEDLP